MTATLQAIAFQTSDLIDAMADDGMKPSVLRVDGGMVGNNWLLQFLADILDITVERPDDTESTVLGAASLAALECGVLASIGEIERQRGVDRVFEPQMEASRREALLAGWRKAVARVSQTGVTI